MILTAVVRFKTGDADCSSLIKRIMAAVGLLDIDTYMWTGNEQSILNVHGFERRNKWHPRRGDVLWREGHTEMYLGDGVCGGARIDERGSVYGATSGDQTGREVASSAYDPDRWEECWRYVGDATVGGIPIPEAMAQLMEHAIEHDESHGYSQTNREGDGGWEDVSLHYFIESKEDNDMQSIISIRGRNTLVWFDGQGINDLTTTGGVNALDTIHKACNGTTMPRVTLSEDEFAYLCQSIKGGYPKHLKSLVDKYPTRSPEE